MTAEPTTSGGVPEVPFQGRDAELGRLTELLVRLDQGLGGAVRIVGGAGSGKTRLVAEAVRTSTVSVARGGEGSRAGAPARRSCRRSR